MSQRSRARQRQRANVNVKVHAPSLKQTWGLPILIALITVTGGLCVAFFTTNKNAELAETQRAATNDASSLKDRINQFQELGVLGWEHNSLAYKHAELHIEGMERSILNDNDKTVQIDWKNRHDSTVDLLYANYSKLTALLRLIAISSNTKSAKTAKNLSTFVERAEWHQEFDYQKIAQDMKEFYRQHGSYQEFSVKTLKEELVKMKVDEYKIQLVQLLNELQEDIKTSAKNAEHGPPANP